MGAIDISILVCAYNEEQNIQHLYDRLIPVLETLSNSFEIVIVDDGSRDQTSLILHHLSESDPRLRNIRLVRNFGQHAAFAAGMRSVRGQHVIWMDADLQDLPEEIPIILAGLRDGHPLVYGVRQDRQDSWFRRVSSDLYFQVFQRLASQDLPRGMSTFRGMSRAVVDAFNDFGERRRITAGLMGWMGFPYLAVPVRHGLRHAGQSKYPLSKLLLLAWESVSAFSTAPLRAATFLGFTMSLFSFVVIAAIIWRKVFYGFVVTGYASLMVTILLIGGIQLLVVGLLGEYIGRILTEVQGRPLYVVQQNAQLDKDV